MHIFLYLRKLFVNINTGWWEQYKCKNVCFFQTIYNVQNKGKMRKTKKWTEPQNWSFFFLISFLKQPRLYGITIRVDMGLVSQHNDSHSKHTVNAEEPKEVLKQNKQLLFLKFIQTIDSGYPIWYSPCEQTAHSSLTNSPTLLSVNQCEVQQPPCPAVSTPWSLVARSQGTEYSVSI